MKIEFGLGFVRLLRCLGDPKSASCTLEIILLEVVSYDGPQLLTVYLGPLVDDYNIR